MPISDSLMRRHDGNHRRRYVADRGDTAVCHDDRPVLEDFLVGLTQTQHQAGFGQHIRAIALGVRQYGDGLFVGGPGIADRMRQPFHRFHILGEHLDGLLFGALAQLPQQVGLQVSEQFHAPGPARS